MREHWENVYSKNEISSLGWYQEKPEPSLKLLKSLDIAHDDPILIAGAGATTLIDHLLEEGYRKIIACDISQNALDHLRKRLGDRSSIEIRRGDLTVPKGCIDNVRLWHDRAVLHFLLSESDRRMYWRNMNESVVLGGYVIIATFSMNGASRCSGLEVRRYNRDSLKEFMGDSYSLIESFEYIYTNPSGSERPYIYTCFQKIRKE